MYPSHQMHFRQTDECADRYQRDNDPFSKSTDQESSSDSTDNIDHRWLEEGTLIPAFDFVSGISTLEQNPKSVWSFSGKHIKSFSHAYSSHSQPSK